ncbi:MAG: putative aminopeptidase YsdC [Firmicutes bacterium]|nr:putative aminopeptidase YsdC [Bacillota bacterium]MBT9158047.1 putative aminopeptidase YsdC [Bacillota bacterium]
MESKEFLKLMVEQTGVSGFENPVAEVIKKAFATVADDVCTDVLGNVIARKQGEGDERISIMLAAHMDEIGMMITKIEEGGFLKFIAIGGIDQRTLVAQEVKVHGKRDVLGIIGMKPPHLLSPEEVGAAIKMQDMVIDLGLPIEQVKELVTVGDLVTVHRPFIALAGDFVAGKAMDDRAAVAVLLECLQELQKIRHKADVYAVATVQEEVGLRGALVSTYHIAPQIGIAIDVCHGEMPGVPEQDTAPMGKGPNIALGANIHPKLYERLVEVAKEHNIPYTIDPVPGPSGTDAWAMQVTRSGVPTALVSLPLRYMHTSVETLSMADVKSTGRLLAYFIASIDKSFVEGLLCY